MKKTRILTFFSALILMSLFSAKAATIIADFEGGSPLSGWANPNSWNVISDPADGSNSVLNTSGRGNNFNSGISLGTPVDGSTSISFDFRLTTTTNADISIYLTDEPIGNFSGLADAASDFFGPTLRLLDNKIQIFDGGFTDLSQSVSINTWYTINMDVNNTTDTWSASILGGSFVTPTTLTLTGGSDSNFDFRNPTGDLQSVGFRANTNNSSGSGGALIDNMVIIPEPSSLLLMMTALGLLGLLKRRRV